MSQVSDPVIFFQCTWCRATTPLAVLAVRLAPADEGYPTAARYAFGTCASCKEVALVIQEDTGDGFDADTPVRLFPRDERTLSFELPQVVGVSYAEAVKCERAGASLAVCVMVGRALEAVCKASFPDARSIFEGLKLMSEKGTISEQLVDWANELRFLRNIAAHATQRTVSHLDARDALDFLQAILETLYQLQPRFEDLKARRKLGSKPPEDLE